jgi:hypothetical protein
MVYSTRNFWVSDLNHRAVFQGTHDVSKSWALTIELISIIGQLVSTLYNYLSTSDQDNWAGDNKEVYNKNSDKPRTCVELGRKKERRYLCYKHPARLSACAPMQ